MRFKYAELAVILYGSSIENNCQLSIFEVNEISSKHGPSHTLPGSSAGTLGTVLCKSVDTAKFKKLLT